MIRESFMKQDLAGEIDVAMVAVGLLAVAAPGAYLPARRASLLNRNCVLRQD